MKQLTSYAQHAVGSFHVYRSRQLSAIVLQANNWTTGKQLDQVFPTTGSTEPDTIIEAIQAGQAFLKTEKTGPKSPRTVTIIEAIQAGQAFLKTEKTGPHRSRR